MRARGSGPSSGPTATVNSFTVPLSLLVYEGITDSAFSDLRCLVAQNCLDVSAIQTALFYFFQSRWGRVRCSSRGSWVAQEPRAQMHVSVPVCFACSAEYMQNSTAVTALVLTIMHSVSVTQQSIGSMMWTRLTLSLPCDKALHAYCVSAVHVQLVLLGCQSSNACQCACLLCLLS